MQRGDLGRLDYLGKGGQGVVYHAPDLQLPDVPHSLVFKEYKKNQGAPAGLHSIIGVRRRMAEKQRESLDQRAAWPVDVVHDGTEVVGAIMPLIPPSYFRERQLPGTGKRSRSPIEVQYLFIDQTRCHQLNMPVASFKERLIICRDLAQILDLLHRSEVVFGDINAKNALFRLGDSPSVMLVDCDAVRIAGQGSVVKQLNAPDWDPPEGPDNLNLLTDRYKYGLFVLRALLPGHGASTQREPRAVEHLLDDEGRQLLHAALLGPKEQRPELNQWIRYFHGKVSGSAKPASKPAAPQPTVAPGPNGSQHGWRKDPDSGRWVPA